MDWFGTQAKRRVASLETENSVYRSTNIDLNNQLKHEKESVARLTKSYQDEVGKNGKLNLELVQLKTKLADAEVSRDHNANLAEERWDCLAAMTDENKDLAHQVETLAAILKQIHVVVKLPVRKTDKK